MIKFIKKNWMTTIKKIKHKHIFLLTNESMKEMTGDVRWDQEKLVKDSNNVSSATIFFFFFFLFFTLFYTQFRFFGWNILYSPLSPIYSVYYFAEKRKDLHFLERRKRSWEGDNKIEDLRFLGRRRIWVIVVGSIRFCFWVRNSFFFFFLIILMYKNVED